MTKKNIIFICLALVWMCVIFAFSSRDADESSKDSYEVGIVVGHIIIPDFEDKTKEEQIEFAKKIDFPVRKCAHATEFAVLALLLAGVFNKRRYILAWIFATLYAVTDELHQLFVPGRACRAFDVMIDSSGALLALLCLYGLVHLFSRWKSKNIE